MKMREITAIVLTVVGLAAVVVAPFAYERARLKGPAGIRTIVLTGIARDGIWTQDAVTGANYWKGGFEPAHLSVAKGETIRLVLRSADVVHRFYMPSVGIGPVELQPGHTEEVLFHADREEAVPYYCTAPCVGGLCHYYMRGAIAVGAQAPGPEELCLSHSVPPPPASAGIVEYGRYVFGTKGCVTCHGQDGAGGVPNFNYAKRTVPRLNTLAEKMFLAGKQDVAALTRVLERGEDPAHLAAAPPIANWPVVLAQYEAVVSTIRLGSIPAKAHADRPAPPLFMPRWNETLDRKQIDSVIAFLVSEEKFESNAGWGN